MSCIKYAAVSCHHSQLNSLSATWEGLRQCVQVRELAAYLQRRSAAKNRLALEVGKVIRIQQVGMGDRSALQAPLAWHGDLLLDTPWLLCLHFACVPSRPAPLIAFMPSKSQPMQAVTHACRCLAAAAMLRTAANKIEVCS